ncbi:MAG: inferenceab initio prediction:Prodigal:2 [Mycobacterium sp.]|nr:inferenceab initio prediction:Prodigal:2 [Mycobacterium sp.]
MLGLLGAMMASTPRREGIEANVFRTVNDQPSLWDSILPPELLVLPVELGRVDVLLDDPVFFAPFAAYFDARIGRPSIPVETYLRLMFLKFRCRLGYESLCREVSDSISWQRFCPDPVRYPGAASDDVDEDHHPLRRGRGRWAQ